MGHIDTLLGYPGTLAPDHLADLRKERAHLFPHRKLSGRLVFVRLEIEALVSALAGVSLEQALENLRARDEGAR